MWELILYFSLALGVSFLCSLLEAVLLLIILLLLAPPDQRQTDQQKA